MSGKQDQQGSQGDTGAAENRARELAKALEEARKRADARGQTGRQG